jgi:hypothetical protein
LSVRKSAHCPCTSFTYIVYNENNMWTIVRFLNGQKASCSPSHIAGLFSGCLVVFRILSWSSLFLRGLKNSILLYFRFPEIFKYYIFLKVTKQNIINFSPQIYSSYQTFNLHTKSTRKLTPVDGLVVLLIQLLDMHNNQSNPNHLITVIISKHLNRNSRA